MTTPRAIGALTTCLLVAAGCATGGGDDFGIGVQRIALALAFREEELAEPVEPEVIIRMVPAPPEVRVADDLEPFRTPETPAPEPVSEGPFSLLPTCDPAPAGSVPVDVVTFDIADPPTPGRYSRHNTGTIEVSGGPFPLTLPFPPLSSSEVSEAEVHEEAELGGLLGPTVTLHEYEVRHVLAPGFEITERFRLRPDRLQLVRRTVVSDEATTVFEPTPAIDFYVFGTEGTSWASAGADLERGSAMLLEGRITQREVVDVCGVVLDTYRVEVTEQLVDLASGSVSGTASGDVDVYNVATHLGLVVREDVHQTVATTDPATGSALVIELEYLSTLDGVEPEPIEPEQSG